MSDVILGKYQILDTIGHGTFGEVKKARLLETGQLIAIKFERGADDSRKLLFNESETLSQLQGGVGIPKLYAFGKHEDRDYMVTELLGENLAKLFKACGRTFGIQTIAKIAVQTIERIEFVHNRGFLHRDMKPENLLVGLQAKDTVYLTDFGLGKKYINLDFGMHIPFKKDKSFVGTPTYASLNMHMGLQQSRRDDLQSLFFVLLFFLKGRLPWQNPSSPSKGKSLMQKLLLTPAELFEGFPSQFVTSLTYIRSLQFEQHPDYAYIKNQFSEWSNSTTHMDWLLDAPIKRHKKRAHTSSANLRSEKSEFATYDITEHSKTPDTHRRHLVGTENGQPPRKTVTFSVAIGGGEGSASEDSQEDTIKESRLPTLDREKLRAKINLWAI